MPNPETPFRPLLNQPKPISNQEESPPSEYINPFIHTHPFSIFTLNPRKTTPRCPSPLLTNTSPAHPQPTLPRLPASPTRD